MTKKKHKNAKKRNRTVRRNKNHCPKPSQPINPADYQYPDLSPDERDLIHALDDQDLCRLLNQYAAIQYALSVRMGPRMGTILFSPEQQELFHKCTKLVNLLLKHPFYYLTTGPSDDSFDLPLFNCRNNTPHIVAVLTQKSAESMFQSLQSELSHDPDVLDRLRLRALPLDLLWAENPRTHKPNFDDAVPFKLTFVSGNQPHEIYTTVGTLHTIFSFLKNYYINLSLYEQGQRFGLF